MTGLPQSSPDLQMKCSEGVIEGRKLQTWDLSGLKLLVPVDFPSTLSGFLVRQVAKDFKSNPPRNRALRASCDFGAPPQIVRLRFCCGLKTKISMEFLQRNRCWFARGGRGET